jgi:hypothetical protein
MKKFIITLIVVVGFCQSTFGQIGSWKAYMAYSEIQEIEKAGDELFVMASNDLYQYNLNDQSIYTYDKTNGLSDTNIRHIKWCPEAQRLIVVYQNSNIDLVETDGDIINISDLYTKVITGDKSVSSIRIDDIYAYLICGFGIVKVNMERAEISDSYTPNHPEYPTNLPEEDNSSYEQYIETVKTLNPGGPKYNYFDYMKFVNNKLYTCGGKHLDYTLAQRPGTIQIWNGTEWTFCQDELDEITGYQYKDITCVDVDPKDPNRLFASSSHSGLYEFYNEKLVNFYNADNSILFPVAGNKNMLLTDGVIFDKEGNLWIISGWSETMLVKLTTNNQWINYYDKHQLLQDNRSPNLGNLLKPMIDSRNLLWFVNSYWEYPAIICYDINNDAVKIFNQFKNQDGIIYNIGHVYGIKEDMEGNIWVATNLGPFILESDEIEKDNYTFIQIKVPRNDGTDYADYLLSNISIYDITIDDANRKWFSTESNGVYLISADNLQQLQHFTNDNSKLLSNTVYTSAINPNTGEVFFATENGLCSYMSDATKANSEMTKDNVYAYPNPVDFSNYSGLITITGLTFNADIKITNAAGFLIAEGRSNGGTFTWDGRDKKGNRVGSGVYMVTTATNSGQKGTVCKIAIIN